MGPAGFDFAPQEQGFVLRQAQDPEQSRGTQG